MSFQRGYLPCYLYLVVVTTMAWLAMPAASRGLSGVEAAQGGRLRALPPCMPAIFNDTRGYITSWTNARTDLKAVKIESNPSKFVADDPFTMDKITRASLLPCDPRFTMLMRGGLSTAPSNVRRVAALLPLSKWTVMINASLVGTAGGNGPPPTGFVPPTVSWMTFLSIVARFPFFCGEKGTWQSKTIACQRELATVFAHTAQETGNGIPGTVPWNTMLQYTREQNCYINKNCVYDTDIMLQAFNAPDTMTNASYYGRGAKQVCCALRMPMCSVCAMCDAYQEGHDAFSGFMAFYKALEPKVLPMHCAISLFTSAIPYGLVVAGLTVAGKPVESAHCNIQLCSIFCWLLQ
jgi:hypothetical protein